MNYFLSIMNIFFYVLLIFFIYFNIVAQNNFLKSNEIIISNVSPKCEPNLTNLTKIDPNVDGSIEQCLDPSEYLYSVPNSSLKFIVSNDEGEAASYSSLCKSYCGQIEINGTCSKKTPAFNECVSILEPPSGCNNSSKPLGININNGKLFYAVKTTSQKSCQ